MTGLWYNSIYPEDNSSVALIKQYFRNSSVPFELYGWCNASVVTWATSATMSVLSTLASTVSPATTTSAQSAGHSYAPRDLSCVHSGSGWPHLPTGEPFGLLVEGLCNTKRASKELDDNRTRTLVGPDCSRTPNPFLEVFFFSSLLFIGTFVLSWSLKAFKSSRYFKSTVRYFPLRMYLVLDLAHFVAELSLLI